MSRVQYPYARPLLLLAGLVSLPAPAAAAPDLEVLIFGDAGKCLDELVDVDGGEDLCDSGECGGYYPYNEAWIEREAEQRDKTGDVKLGKIEGWIGLSLGDNDDELEFSSSHKVSDSELEPYRDALIDSFDLDGYLLEFHDGDLDDFLSESGLDLGACQQRRVAEQMQAACDSGGCDLGLSLGDNIYGSGATDGESFLFEANWGRHYDGALKTPDGGDLPIYVSMGNHDADADAWKGADEDDLLAAQYDYSDHSDTWRMPADEDGDEPGYYSFKEEGVRFFAINSNTFLDDSAQQAWLQGALEDSVDAGDSWRVVYGHHPVISSGSHGDDAMTAQLNDALLPTLCASADFYVSGHDHNLEAMLADCGVGLIVSGAAGESRRVDPDDLVDQHLWSPGEDCSAPDGELDRVLGFARMKFFADEVKVKFYYTEDDDLADGASADTCTWTYGRVPRDSDVSVINENRGEHVAASSVALDGEDDVVVQASDDGADTLTWRVQPILSGSRQGHVQLENQDADPDTCLEITDDSYDDGAVYNLFHARCDDAKRDQAFTLKHGGGDAWQLESVGEPGYCLHALTGSVTGLNDDSLVAKACKDTSSGALDKQLFRFEAR